MSKRKENLIPKHWDYTIRNVFDEQYKEQLHIPSTEVNVKYEWKNGSLIQCITKLKVLVAKQTDIVCGIACPQVGINKRLFVINFNGNCTTYINPFINKVYEPRFATQTCSSCGNKEYVAIRYNTIDVYYQTPGREGKPVGVKLTGRIALEFQKLYDILCGIYLADKDNATLEYTDEVKLLTDEQKKQIIEQLTGNNKNGNE